MIFVTFSFGETKKKRYEVIM